MNISNYFVSIYDFILVLPFSLFDLMLLMLGILFVYQEIVSGIKNVLLHLSAFVISLLFGFLIYPIIANFVESRLPFIFQGYVDIFCYLIVSGSCFFLLTIIFEDFVGTIVVPRESRFLKFVIGAVACISAFFLAMFFYMLFICLPVPVEIKIFERHSVISEFILPFEQTIEFQTKLVNRASPFSTLGFLTLPPSSTVAFAIPFSSHTRTEDGDAEKKLLTFLNQERAKNTEVSLQQDPHLSNLAKNIAFDMQTNNYFGHANPAGITFFDKLQQVGVIYSDASESIALSQTIELAFNGLNHSMEDKNNFLSSSFRSVGIAVVDTGSTGLLVVLAFTD